MCLFKALCSRVQYPRMPGGGARALALEVWAFVAVVSPLTGNCSVCGAARPPLPLFSGTRALTAALVSQAGQGARRSSLSLPPSSGITKLYCDSVLYRCWQFKSGPPVGETLINCAISPAKHHGFLCTRECRKISQLLKSLRRSCIWCNFW